VDGTWISDLTVSYQHPDACDTVGIRLMSSGAVNPATGNIPAAYLSGVTVQVSGKGSSTAVRVDGDLNLGIENADLSARGAEWSYGIVQSGGSLGVHSTSISAAGGGSGNYGIDRASTAALYTSSTLTGSTIRVAGADARGINVRDARQMQWVLSDGEITATTPAGTPAQALVAAVPPAADGYEIELVDMQVNGSIRATYPSFLGVYGSVITASGIALELDKANLDETQLDLSGTTVVSDETAVKVTWSATASATARIARSSITAPTVIATHSIEPVSRSFRILASTLAGDVDFAADENPQCNNVYDEAGTLYRNKCPD
jgi:hypothetical protein